MTRAGWSSSGTGQCWRSWTGHRSARWRSGTGCRGSRCTRGRPGTRRLGSTGCGSPRGGRGPRRPGSRPRLRRWYASCGGPIRGGVPGGSRSRWRSEARRARRRGRRCTVSWSATRWSRRRPSSTSASTGGGPGRRRWRCGSWTWSAESTWPPAGSARCSPASMTTPATWSARPCWPSRPRGRWPTRSPPPCGSTGSRRRC